MDRNRLYFQLAIALLLAGIVLLVLFLAWAGALP